MQFLFITCLAVCSVVHGLGSSTIDGMLPIPTFLKDVSSTDSWLFNEFQNNPHLTRDEVDFVLEVWAEAQSDSVQSAFNAWSANVSSATKELIAESDVAVGNLSNDAQQLYSDLKPVFTNPKLTEIDRCTQLTTIQSNSPDSIVKELLDTVPIAAGGCNNGVTKHGSRVRRNAALIRLPALAQRTWKARFGCGRVRAREVSAHRVVVVVEVLLWPIGAIIVAAPRCQPSERLLCECPDDYAGDDCETHIICDDHDCGINATCTVFNHRISCNCPYGYTGDPQVECKEKKHQACFNGDPHYRTFDGANYDYQGTCPYVVTETCNGSDFRVTARNYKDHDGDKVSHIRSFEVFTQDHLISVDKAGNLFFDGFIRFYPFYYPSASSASITVTNTFGSIEVRDLLKDAVVTYKSESLCVSVPETPDFYGTDKLCGLLGNIDDNCKNDYRLANGTTIAVDDCQQGGSQQAVTFADSWVTDLGDNCVLGTVDTNNTHCVVENAQIQCSDIRLAMNATGPFAACQPLGQDLISNAFYDCVYDICHESDPCKIYAAFAGYCLDNLPFADLDNWRNGVNCPYECPAHSKYSLKTPNCQSTCSSPNATDSICIDGYKEGCICDTGYLLDSSGATPKCIPQDDCGCLDECGNYYPPHTQWIGDDCHNYYECANGNLTTNPINCSINGFCSNDNGHEACQCQPGFTGDGYSCTDVNECALNATLCGADVAHGICINTPGSYHCDCNLPWNGDNCDEYRPSRHCADLYVYHGIHDNGVYNVSIGAVYGSKTNDSFNGILTEVYCDMESDDGGWTLMSAGNKSSDRNFDQYKYGFGNPYEQAVWLGLERIHLLTNQTETSLRLTLERCPRAALPRVITTCTYAQFSVYNADTQYAVYIPNYCQGNETYPYQDGWVDWPINELGPAFQTYDISGNCNTKPCAENYHRAGWWFGQSRCGFVNLNGIRPQCEDIASGTYQYYLTWRSEMLEEAWLYLRPRQYPHYDATV